MYIGRPAPTLEPSFRRPEARDRACSSVATTDQLPDLAATIGAVAAIVRAGGVLAVRVPNGLFFRRAVDTMRSSSAALARVLRTTLAWNNLLGFPYLYGYSLPTLDRLLGRVGFTRVDVRPDTLVRLSDAATKMWAHAEERLVKFVCRAAWTLAPPTRAHELAPWLDVYFKIFSA